MALCRKGDGDNAAAGEPQQLYEPVDLHGVQRPPASSRDALLPRHSARALAYRRLVDVRHVVHDHRAAGGGAGDATSTIRAVNDSLLAPHITPDFHPHVT